MATQGKYVVTGGAGFIGSHLVDRLIKEGHSVLVIDDLSSGKKENLNLKATFWNEDITQIDFVEFFKANKIDGVFHLAANPSVRQSFDEPDRTTRINLDATMRIFGATPARIVFASSSAVYGDTNEFPTTTESLKNPSSPYGMQKLIADFNSEYFNQIVPLRFFNVYGPRQNPDSGYAALIPKTIQRLKNNERPIIFGDGRQTRDFVYVDDVVDALIKAMNCEYEFIDRYNIGSGTETTVETIVGALGAISGKNVKPEHKEPAIEPKRSCADISDTISSLRWKPTTKLIDGLKKTYESY